jgi:hypothetical protein
LGHDRSTRWNLERGNLERGKRRTNPCLYTVVLYNNLVLLLQGGCSAGISRLVLAYFLSQNTIHSTSRVLFILPAEHPQDSSGPSECLHLSPLSLYFLDEIEIIQFSSICWQHNKLDKVISIRQRKDKLRGTDICWQAKNFTLTGQYCHYYNWLWKKDNTNSSPRSKMIVK